MIQRVDARARRASQSGARSSGCERLFWRTIGPKNRTAPVHCQAHPKIREAIDDFNARWRGPYEGFREAMYTQAVSRISGEFLQAYRYLVDRTGNDPNALCPVSETDLTLSHSSYAGRALGDLEDRRKEFAPFLREAPGEFREALMDFSGRWSAALAAVAAAAAAAEPLALESMMKAVGWLGECWPNSRPRLKSSPQKAIPTSSISIRTEMTSAMSFRCRTGVPQRDELRPVGRGSGMGGRNSGAGFQRSASPMEGYSCHFSAAARIGHVRSRRTTRVVDLPGSDQIGLPRRADLAATALCRTTTEVLIRCHYANHVPDVQDPRETKLREAPVKVN